MAAPCHICGSTVIRDTGECDFCGAYVCKECNSLHLGEADRPCPGNGVPIPAEAEQPPRTWRKTFDILALLREAADAVEEPADRT
jgi:hypothetical protein